MRLVGVIQGIKDAHKFSLFLEQEGIECKYEPDSSNKDAYYFWVVHEEELKIAEHWLKEFKKNPTDSRFETNIFSVFYIPCYFFRIINKINSKFIICDYPLNFFNIITK